MSNKIFPILFISLLLNTSSLMLKAQTSSVEAANTSLYGGFNYQVQEFQLLNQQIGEDCNCLEGNRLNKRAIQSVNLSLFKLKPNWAWAAALGYGSGYGMDDDKSYYSIRTIQTRVDLFYHFKQPNNKLRPYLGAGVQWAFNSHSNLLSIPVGAGLRYRLPSGTYLHLQTAYDYGITRTLAQNLITQVGIHFNLGKSKPRSESKAAQPIAADPIPVIVQAKPETAVASIPPADPVKPADNTASSSVAANIQSDKPVDKAEADKEAVKVQASPRLAKVVYFDTDQSTLNKAGTMETLLEVGAFAKNYPNTQILLSGHTDNVLDQAYNLALSKRRVDAVKQWLLQQGIAISRIKIAFSGKSSPVSDNNSPEGRAANRRVEIELK